MLDQLGVGPVTLLVVPDFHRQGSLDRSRGFCRAIDARLEAGDEVALHGYYHLDDSRAPRALSDWFLRRVMTAAEGEFAAIASDAARERLSAGLTMLHAQGWPVHGFVAPAWQLGAAAQQVLTEFPFEYTTSRTEVCKLPQWRAYRSPSLVYSVRSRARRWLSRYWNDYLADRQAAERLLRISLHPADASYPEVMQHWLRLIAAAAQERQVVTKRAWVAGQS
jgi:predicted deacetylase